MVSDKHRAWLRKRYAQNRTRLQEYKVKMGCKDCGYNTHHAGLELDHVIPPKRANISRLVDKGWNAIQRELDKCEVVCGTCHNIRTWTRKYGIKS